MKSHDVSTQLLCGKISATPSIADRENYPFGVDEFVRFFDVFMDMSFEFEDDFGSIFMFDAKENAPRHSYASGCIFSQSLDDLEVYVESNGNFPKSIGEIQFDYGGTLEGPRIGAKKN